MQEMRAADKLTALGNVTRLRLYRLLVRAGAPGLNVGELQEVLNVPASTLAHHLTSLVRAGLVEQNRQGREVVSCADYAAMESLVKFLTAECCVGVGRKEKTNAA